MNVLLVILKGVGAVIGVGLLAAGACATVGLFAGVICRCVYLGWHAAWSIFT
jgi:hypothetical protein